jgi:inward rectifier potassium channel
MPRPKARPEPYTITVVGAPPTPFRDAYHALLRMSWWRMLAILVGAFLALNALFAVAYVLTGGVAHARPGSYVDAFTFSIETFGTIGYGEMYPAGAGAHVLVALQAISSLLLTAIATGLMFAKFGRASARMVFAERLTLSPIDGIPTLVVRLGNGRGNRILDVSARLVMMRTERTKEGQVLYRMLDLKLVRERSPALSRAWAIMHRVDEESPLHGWTPSSLAQSEAELTVSVGGLDDATNQVVHSIHRYMFSDIAWGSRPADILSETADGNMRLDLRHFHELVPTTPTPDFPYPG